MSNVLSRCFMLPFVTNKSADFGDIMRRTVWYSPQLNIKSKLKHFQPAKYFEKVCVYDLLVSWGQWVNSIQRKHTLHRTAHRGLHKYLIRLNEIVYEKKDGFHDTCLNKHINMRNQLSSTDILISAVYDEVCPLTPDVSAFFTLFNSWVLYH